MFLFVGIMYKDPCTILSDTFKLSFILKSSAGHLTDYWGEGANFNYQDNIETNDRFKCHDTIKFIVKKVNHCCFPGTALQTFSLRLLGGATAPSPP